MTKDKDAELKLKIGKNIRAARLNKNLTQADVCGDESELTIRQLARIENGQVLISLSKLLFLSQKLNYPVKDLVDIEKIEIPKNYFRDDNPENPPLVSWRSHANLLYSNWLNYFVYQTTPYDIKSIK